MAYNTGLKKLDDLLNFVSKEFDINFSAADVKKWTDELNEGSGRTPEELRNDILEYRVTRERVEEWASQNGVPESDMNGVVDNLMSGKRTFSQAREKYYKEEDAGGVKTAPGTPEGEEGASGGTGGKGGDPETALTILRGKEMQWFYDKTSGKWYVSYGLPGSAHRLLFEADPDQMDALFGDNRRPTNYQNTTLKSLVAQNITHFAGNISEMEGEGDFETEYTKVLDLALENGELPSWMKGSDVALDLLFVAETEGKSNDWLIDQWSKLKVFKDRFPGLDKLKAQGNLTTVEAVDSFLEFEAGMKQMETAMGNSPTKVTPQLVGALINKGWSLEATSDAIKTYDRMKKFAPALSAFNKILAANGKAPLTTQAQWYNFMKGNAPNEYYQIYEASSIQEAATKAGLGDIFSAQDSVDAALAGDFTLQSAEQSMQQAAQLLLRLRGDIEFNRFDLDQEDLIDASLGLKPRSGVSEVELFERVNRATLAAKGNLESRVKPYTSFSNKGVAQQASLGALRPQT